MISSRVSRSFIDTGSSWSSSCSAKSPVSLHEKSSESTDNLECEEFPRWELSWEGPGSRDSECRRSRSLAAEGEARVRRGI